MRARALFALSLVAAGSLGCGDLLGFGDYQAICGPEDGAAPGGRRWATRLGDGAAQEALGVAMGADGAVLVAGSFAGTLDSGGEPITSLGDKDAFVLKLDRDGQPVWSRGFGGPGAQIATRIAAGAKGSVVVAGRFNGQMDVCGAALASDDDEDTDGSATNDEGKADVDKDAFVFALDAEGECLWSKSFGGYGDLGLTGLAIGEDGTVFLAGSFEGSLDLGKPCPHMESQAGTDVWVAALGAGGACQWTRQFDYGGSDVAEGLSGDAAGRLWVTGSCEEGTLAPCDVGTGRNLLLSRLEMTADGGEITSWAFGGAGDQAGLGVFAASGAVLLTGTFGTSLDFGVPLPLIGTTGRSFLASLSTDAAGQLLPGAGWSEGFPGAAPQIGAALAMDSKGAVALTGTYGGGIDLGTGALPDVANPTGGAGGGGGGGGGAARTNAFVGAFDAGGTVQWSRAFGDGKSVVTASAVAVDDEGDMVLAGSLSGSASCGDDPAAGALESAGATDVFLARLRLR